MPQKSWGSIRLLVSLPEDVLLYILKFCDVQSLGSLSTTCKILNRIVEKDSVWLARLRRLTFNGKQNVDVKGKKIPVKDKFRICSNWSKAWFKDATLYKTVVRQMPCIHLDDRTLWFTHKSCIRSFHLRDNGGMYDRPHMVLKAFNDDVSCFAVQESATIAAGSMGSMGVWCSGQLIMSRKKCHNDSIHSIDVHDDLIITGGRDSNIKMWSLTNCEDEDFLRQTVAVGDRVWSVAISPDGNSFVTGTTGCRDVKPLLAWDSNTGKQLSLPHYNYRYGAGILSLQYESPSNLLSCGYDSVIRLWDLRSNKCVREWEDPFDYVIYCVRSNNHNAILSGTCRHGLLRLWDKRMVKPVQMYYTGRSNSPVYSLAFNTNQLYAGLDRSIRMLNFT